MEPRELIKLMAVAEKLKCNTRHSYTSSGRIESVAEHCWRLSLMAYFIQDEFPEADINKILQICIFHDLGEAITGDIPAFDKTERDEEHEAGEVFELLEQFPPFYREKLIPLFREMNELQTLEARIYKALDKMEAVLQHNESDLSTWLPMEREYNVTYGTESVEFSEYMMRLKQELNEDTLRKIAAEG